MRFQYFTGLTTAAALAALLTLGVRAQEDEARPDLPEGVEVLARGPVHEAFAEPSDPQPKSPPVVTKEPPAPIEEQPPEQKPEGENVVFLPGYWNWDEDAEEFIWVSGFWRDVPPDR